MTAKVYDLQKYRKKIAKQQRAKVSSLVCGNPRCRKRVHLDKGHISQVGEDAVWCSRACWLASVEEAT